MICMYLNLNEHAIEYSKEGNKHKVTQYIPQECFGEKCPFYSDGTGEYIEGVCIRAEKEKEE